MTESAPTPSQPQTPPPPSVLVRGFLPGLVLGVVVGVIVGIFSSELMRQPVVDVDPNATVRTGTGDREAREPEGGLEDGVDEMIDDGEQMLDEAMEEAPAEEPDADAGNGDG